MQSGYHFFLDDISKEEKQEVIFSYTKVWLKDEHQLKEQGITSTEAIPTYPIYVTINQDAATFHFIGLVASEGGNIKWIAQHFEILSLPLFPNLELKDDLSETLVKIIDEAVEVERDLYECEREREAFSVSKAKKGLLDALESNSNQPKNGQGFFAQPLFTYSSLEEVVLFSTSEDRPSVEKSRLFDTTSLGQLSESDENGKKAFIPKRELLLDFLFDFTHSSVFDNSIHKVNVEVKLKECPLTDAVINKCEYYFARENYFLSAQIDNYNSLTGSRRDNSIRKSWSEKLESAEKDYVNTIISDGATEVFMNSGGWLFPVEQELKAVIFNDNPHTKHIINTIFKKIKNRANYPAISLPKKVTNLGFRFIFRVVSLMRKFKFILPLFVLVMAFFPFKWIFQPNVLHFFLAAIFIFLIVAYFIRKIAEAFKGSINEKDRKRRTYNRAIWQRWIKKEIEREFKGKESPVIRKSLEENRLQNQLFQRATNNFFLRRYNIHQAYRNSIPYQYRLWAGILVFPILFVPLIILLHYLCTQIFELSAFHIITFSIFHVSLPKGLFEFDLEISLYLLTTLGIISTLSFPLAYLIYRYGYIGWESINTSRFNTFTFLLDFTICLFLLSILYIHFDISMNYPETPKNHLFLLAFSMGLIIYCILNLRYIINKRCSWDRSTEKKYEIGGAIILSIIGLGFSAFITQNFWVITGIFTVLVFVLNYIVRRQDVENLYWFTFNLILPRMQMAIISSWILLISTEELWKANLDIPPIILAVIIFVLIALAFYYMGYVMMNKVPDLPWEGLLTRSFILLIYGFLFSFAFGVLSMNIIGEKMLLNSGLLQERYPIGEVEEIGNYIEGVKFQSIEFANAPTALSLCRASEELIKGYGNEQGRQMTLLGEALVQLQQKLAFSRAYYNAITRKSRQKYYIHCETVDNPIQEGKYLGRFKAFEDRFRFLELRMRNEDFSSGELQKALLVCAEDLDQFDQELMQFAQGLIHDFKAINKKYSSGFYHSRYLFNKLKENDLLIERDIIFHLGLSETNLENPEEDCKYQDSNRQLLIFPRLLLVNTTLALFVGLFFQVVSQDRSITDPLG